MNKLISAIFVKVKVDMLGLIVHDSLDITSVNFKHKKNAHCNSPKKEFLVISLPRATAMLKVIQNTWKKRE